MITYDKNDMVLYQEYVEAAYARDALARLFHDAQVKVAQFHETFGHPIAETPGLVGEGESGLRYALIKEELDELREAQAAGDLVEVADALGDLLYVVYGTALAYGINLKPVFDEVHRSNMSKADADGRPVPHPTVPGKIGKSDLFTPPDIAGVLKKQGWEG